VRLWRSCTDTTALIPSLTRPRLLHDVGGHLVRTHVRQCFVLINQLIPDIAAKHVGSILR